MDTAFPHTVTVSLENDHRTAKARAMFNSGAGATLMTENLATTLGLKTFSPTNVYLLHFGTHQLQVLRCDSTFVSLQVLQD